MGRTTVKFVGLLALLCLTGCEGKEAQMRALWDEVAACSSLWDGDVDPVHWYANSEGQYPVALDPKSGKLYHFCQPQFFDSSSPQCKVLSVDTEREILRLSDGRSWIDVQLLKTEDGWKFASVTPVVRGPIPLDKTEEECRQEFEALQQQIQTDPQDCSAMTKLAGFYYRGYGTEVDREKYFEWIERAAKADDVTSMVTLAQLYFQRGDDEQQIYWLKQAAELGDVGAMFSLGAATDDIEWMERSAESGNSWAMAVLGNEYREQEDLESAVKWWNKAAQHGESFAMRMLSSHYAQQKDEAPLAWAWGVVNGWFNSISGCEVGFHTIFQLWENMNKEQRTQAEAELERILKTLINPPADTIPSELLPPYPALPAGSPVGSVAVEATDVSK